MTEMRNVHVIASAGLADDTPPLKGSVAGGGGRCRRLPCTARRTKRLGDPNALLHEVGVRTHEVVGALVLSGEISWRWTGLRSRLWKPGSVCTRVGPPTRLVGADFQLSTGVMGQLVGWRGDLEMPRLA